MSIELVAGADDECGLGDNNVIVKRPLSMNAKRRLRRERLTASRAGVVVSYQPISEPPAGDGPKLTNTAKRMARKRKKFALECETLGEDEVRTKIKALVKEKRKKKKKRESSKIVICKTTVKSSVKPSSKNNPGHIRFSDEEDDEPEDNKLEDGLSMIKAEVKESKIKEEEDELNDDDDDDEVDDNALKNTSEDATIEKKSKPNKPDKKRRFVLFVGNLSYDATAEDIKVHFFKVGPIVDIRMARYVEEEKKDKCRGFCHLEVKDEETYLKALSMNHTYLGKRRINVEYSSGQTQEKRVEQKQKRAKIKEMIKTGDMFEYLNPTHGPSKAVRRTTAKRKTQAQGNKFWV